MAQNMNIAIDPEVHVYLDKKKRKYLVLDLLKSGGGCCPTYDVTEISYKKPVDTTLYQSTSIEGVEIFISNKVIISAPVLRFSVEKMGLIKQIVVKGLHLKGDR